MKIYVLNQEADPHSEKVIHVEPTDTLRSLIHRIGDEFSIGYGELMSDRILFHDRVEMMRDGTLLHKGHDLIKAAQEDESATLDGCGIKEYDKVEVGYLGPFEVTYRTSKHKTLLETTIEELVSWDMAKNGMKITVSPNDTYAQIKLRVGEPSSGPRDNQTLLSDGVFARTRCGTITDSAYIFGQSIDLDDSMSIDEFIVFVHIPAYHSSIRVVCKATDTVSALRDRISTRSRDPNNRLHGLRHVMEGQFVLYYFLDVLDDNNTLNECGLATADTRLVELVSSSPITVSVYTIGDLGTRHILDLDSVLSYFNVSMLKERISLVTRVPHINQRLTYGLKCLELDNTPLWQFGIEPSVESESMGLAIPQKRKRENIEKKVFFITLDIVPNFLNESRAKLFSGMRRNLQQLEHSPFQTTTALSSWSTAHSSDLIDSTRSWSSFTEKKNDI